MAEYSLLISFTFLFGIAFLLGILFNRLNLPVLIAYLSGGVLIGPHGFKIVTDVKAVESASEVGLILLMFLLGLSFPLKKIISIGISSIIAGVGQVFISMSLVTLMVFIFNGSLQLGFILGSVIALSSTAIVIKILNETHQVSSSHGKQMIACLIVQDIVAIVMIVIFPRLKEFSFFSSSSYLAFLFIFFKGLVFLSVAYLLSKKVIPKIGHWVAEHGSRELFLIASVTFCLGMSILSHGLGLSFALGAFVGGLLVSESDYNYQIIAGMTPLRDAFLCVFFVALGLLFDPFTIWKEPFLIIGLCVFILLGKFLITSGVYMASGSVLKTALITGVGLAQVGEFSLVLLKISLDNNLVNDRVYQILVSSSILTMFLSPFLFKYFPKILYHLSNIPKFGHFLSGKEDVELERMAYSISNREYVIICGFGPIGITLANVFKKAKIKYLALDLNAGRIKGLKKLKLNCFYGDASSIEVLKKAQVQSATLVIVTIPNLEEVEHIIKSIKYLSNCPILVRSRFNREQEDLYDHGASYVVQEEFVAGLEILRKSLEELLLPHRFIEDEINAIRLDREYFTHFRYLGPLTFAKALTSNQIILNLESTHKSKIIKKLVEKADRFYSIGSADQLFSEVMVREAIVNTSIGNGIAMPHVKSTLVKKVGCVMGIIPKGIEYEAIDKKPVHIVILILANVEANKEYMKLAGSASRLFKDGQLSKDLKRVNQIGEVIDKIRLKEAAIKPMKKIE